MGKLRVFENVEFGELRVFESNDDAWFVAKDVCKILGISKYRDAVARLDSDEASLSLVDTPGGKQQMASINESGLYALILKSRKPEAKKFRKWVTSEVLPSVRKNGGYILGQDQMTPEELMANALMVAQNVIERQKQQLTKAESTVNLLVHQKKLYTSTEVAKEIGFKSANALNEDLRQKKIQYKVNGTWVLTTDYANKGYTSIKEQVLDTGKVIYDRKWTGIGRQFLLNLYKGE